MKNSWFESASGQQGHFLIGNTICHGLIILVEPDDSVRDALCNLLTGEGWQVALEESTETLACALECQSPVAVISESRLPDMDAHRMLELCSKHGVPLIFTGHEQAVQQAVDLVQQGAAGYLEKPFSLARLLRLLDQVPDRHNSGANRRS